ncbi:protein ABHD11-like isoform X2 [Photinus pyralis]|nr:protein ABHD11-like isoform X2 [Photinus pyralis]
MAFKAYEGTSDCGSPLVALHALLGSKEEWDRICRGLSERSSRSIFATDLRNHGESPHCPEHDYPRLAEDLKLFLDQRGMGKASLLGHSMGGNTAMYFSLKYPQLVDKVIVVDISPVSVPLILKSMFNSVTHMLNAQMPSQALSMADARVHIDDQLAKHIKEANVRRHLLNNLIRKPDGSFAWRANSSTLVRDPYANFVTLPAKCFECKFDGSILFLNGGDSTFFPETDRSPILQLFPNAEFQTIQGAGHWPHLQKPYELLRACADFLNKS